MFYKYVYINAKEYIFYEQNAFYFFVLIIIFYPQKYQKSGKFLNNTILPVFSTKIRQPKNKWQIVNK